MFLIRFKIRKFRPNDPLDLIIHSAKQTSMNVFWPNEHRPNDLTLKLVNLIEAYNLASYAS